MVNVFAKSMTMNPYPSVYHEPLSVDMTFEEYVQFEQLPKIEKAFEIMKRMELDVDRRSVMGTWRTYDVFGGDQLAQIQGKLDDYKRSKDDEDAKAYAELVTAGIVDLEDGETFTEEPLPEMPAEASETPFKSIPAVVLGESKPKGAKRAPRGSKKASKKEATDAD